MGTGKWAFHRSKPARSNDADVVRCVQELRKLVLALEKLPLSWKTRRTTWSPTHWETPRALRSRGRVTLKLRVRGSTYRDYHRLDGASCGSARTMAAFSGLCVTLIDTWKHALPHRVAYGNVYARDSSNIPWAIGRIPHTWVQGRRKIRARLGEKGAYGPSATTDQPPIRT